MRVGSLCTGYGGLELALPWEHEIAWQSEIDASAIKVLNRRFPGVPNLGDLTNTDWHSVEPVDVLMAGFPCQPVSSAGRRKGTEDARWIWPSIAKGIDVLSPPIVLLENVRGLFTANGGSAFAEVVATLADLGYVGRWGLVRASDAGAPHQRARWFCVAHAEGVGHERDGEARRRWTGSADRGVAAADATGLGWGERARPQQNVVSDGLQHPQLGAGPHQVQGWGKYAAAVRRWERILGRPAPTPVDDARRLNPVFVEWMMGLPAGWVTDCDLSRTQQLKMLGNGVVPQQARLAWSLLGLAI